MNWYKKAQRSSYTIGPVYHGTRSPEEFTQFKLSGELNLEYPEDIGFHFGTMEQAEDRIGGLPGSRVLPPFYISGNFYWIVSDLGDWSDMEMLREYLADDEDGPFTNAQFDTFSSANDVRSAMQQLGYDGFRYENSFEGGGLDESYVVFSPNNIKLASPETYNEEAVIPEPERYDKENPDFRY